MLSLISWKEETERVRRLLGEECVEVNSNSVNTSEHELNFKFFLPAKIYSLIYYAGLNQREYNFLLVRVAVVCVLSITTALIKLNPIFVTFWLVFLAFEFFALKKRSFKRAEAFEKDYTALLISLASSVRSGIDPLVAFTQAASLFPKNSEMKEEIERVKYGVSKGLSEEKALEYFGQSINHPDVKLFRTAFILARQEGSSLAECLYRLSRVTRQRQSFRRKIRTSVAMQKLSAMGIGGCTVAIGVIQYLMNPEAMQAALQHPVGMKVLCSGIFLVVTGVIWMIRMTKSKI